LLDELLLVSKLEITVFTWGNEDNLVLLLSTLFTFPLDFNMCCLINSSSSSSSSCKKGKSKLEFMELQLLSE
jgi:hypothetical protein